MKSAKQRVVVAKAAYGASLKPVIEHLLDAFPRDWQGKKVLVKPNMLAPHPPEKAVTTHPALVAAVVESLMERGARVMVGDNPGVGGYGRSRKSADVCGLIEASRGCFANLGQRPVRHPVPSRFFDSLAFSADVLEADAVVSLPKLKTHGLTFLTAGIKNTFGYVVGGDKMRVHAACPTPVRFAEALVDIFQVRPPDLTIMDAVVAMEGNGPSNGRPFAIGKVMASDNAVSLDAVAAAMLGLAVKSVPHIEIAGNRGLGETDFSKIAVTGDYAPVSGFRFPSTFVPGMTGILLNRVLSRWIACDPEIAKDRCKSCGLCSAHCPAHAMEMTREGPRLNPKTCIHCYCCQEMCPEDAIRLSGRVINMIRASLLRE